MSKKSYDDLLENNSELVFQYNDNPSKFNNYYIYYEFKLIVCQFIA